MRAFRDQSIMKTKVGYSFMLLFNSWYYSFSPPLATSLQTHPTQRAAFRDTLYPLFVILYASYYAYLSISPISNEAAAVTAGVVAAGLIGAAYLSIPVYLSSRALRRKLARLTLNPYHMLVWTTASVAATACAYFVSGTLTLGGAAANLVLTSLLIGTILGTKGLTFLEPYLQNIPILLLSIKPTSSPSTFPRNPGTT